MKLRKEKSTKSYVAYGIVAVWALLIVKLLTYVPVGVWKGLWTSSVFLVKWATTLSLGTAILVLLIPTLVYIVEISIWAFKYTFSSKVEAVNLLKFPPPFRFKQTWLAIYDFSLEYWILWLFLVWLGIMTTLVVLAIKVSFGFAIVGILVFIIGGSSLCAAAESYR